MELKVFEEGTSLRSESVVRFGILTEDPDAFEVKEVFWVVGGSALNCCLPSFSSWCCWSSLWMFGLLAWLGNWGGRCGGC